MIVNELLSLLYESVAIIHIWKCDLSNVPNLSYPVCVYSFYDVLMELIGLIGSTDEILCRLSAGSRSWIQLQKHRYVFILAFVTTFLYGNRILW